MFTWNKTILFDFVILQRIQMLLRYATAFFFFFLSFTNWKIFAFALLLVYPYTSLKEVSMFSFFFFGFYNSVKSSLWFLVILLDGFFMRLALSFSFPSLGNCILLSLWSLIALCSWRKFCLFSICFCLWSVSHKQWKKWE